MKTSPLWLLLICFLIETPSAESASPPGMVLIPSGTFAMGSTLPGSRKDEQPVVQVSLDSYWMDECAVTNDEFRKFVDATQYKTIAERPIDWEEIKKSVPPGTPKPAAEMLLPGAVTFSPPPVAIDPRGEESLNCQIGL